MLCRKDHTGRTETALNGAVADEGILNFAHTAVFRQSLNRGDAPAFRHQCQIQTAVDADAIYQNGAGTAVAFAATFFRTGQTQILPQKCQKGTIVGYFALDRFAVYGAAQNDVDLVS